MKMVLTLTLIWILSSTTEALRCLKNHDPDNYQTEVTCSSDQLCATTAQRTVNAGPGRGVKEEVIRGCQPSTDCTTKTMSAKVGSEIYALSIRCCNTDLCNNHDVPYPDVTTKNGLKCISCSESEYPECKPIDCVGEQDRCFEEFPDAYDTNHTQGCASAGFCEDLHQSSQMLFDNSGYTRAPICCGSSLCNSVWKVKVSVAPLLLGLVVLVVL